MGMVLFECCSYLRYFSTSSCTYEHVVREMKDRPILPRILATLKRRNHLQKNADVLNESSKIFPPVISHKKEMTLACHNYRVHRRKIESSKWLETSSNNVDHPTYFFFMMGVPSYGTYINLKKQLLQ